MDELDKKIKEALNKNTSLKYNQMIQETMNMVQNGEIPRKDNAKAIKFKQKQKSKFIKYLQSVAAVLVIGMLSMTTYAGVTGKLNINIGNTGHEKIDKNYNEVATAVDKKIDNDYFTFTLESMAADPAYLIFEYDIKLKDKGMEAIGEVSYDEIDGYGITLNSETHINEQEKYLSGGRNLRTIEKVSEKEFRLVEIFCIANIKENVINVNKKMKNLVIYDVNTHEIKLNVDISQILTATVKFENREEKILAEAKLSNGSTLYIEEVSNSKFENFVLARTVSETKKYNEIVNKTNEFMIEDPQFAICNQDDEVINYDFHGLDSYYEKLQEDGSYIVESNIDGEEYVRMQNVQLLKLAIKKGEEPEQIKILPLNRKLYNDRNSSEYEFYMQEDWYQVKTGTVNITEDSQVGGSVTVTRIEETDDKIIFYYDKNGYVPSDIDFVVRIKNKTMNYKFPRYLEYEGIDGDENKIVYTKDGSMMAGIYLAGHERLDNLDELEFAMFYNVKYDVLSEVLAFNWDKNESNEIATIENIEFTEFVKTI